MKSAKDAKSVASSSASIRPGVPRGSPVAFNVQWPGTDTVPDSSPFERRASRRGARSGGIARPWNRASASCAETVRSGRSKEPEPVSSKVSFPESSSETFCDRVQLLERHGVARGAHLEGLVPQGDRAAPPECSAVELRPDLVELEPARRERRASDRARDRLPPDDRVLEDHHAAAGHVVGRGAGDGKRPRQAAVIG